MERQQLEEILRVIIGVSQNWYSIKIKSMMNFLYMMFLTPEPRTKKIPEILRTEA